MNTSGPAGATVDGEADSPLRLDFEVAPPSKTDLDATVDLSARTALSRFRALLSAAGLGQVFGDRIDEAVADVGPVIERCGERQAALAILERLLGHAASARVLLGELFAEGGAHPRVIGGKVVIRRAMGSGSFGTIALLHDPDAPPEDRLQVLKMLKSPTHDPDAAKVVARFLREADILKKLGGSVTPAVLDSGVEGAHAYFVMRYHPGYTLEDLRKSAAPDGFPDGLVNVLGVELALRMATIHDRGVRHRDLKPANVLVGDDGQLRIIDFGLAAAARDYRSDIGRITSPTEVMGTPGYMAPEQIKSPLTVTEQADVYSLGCTLYHLHTGRLPFIGETATELIRLQEDAAAEPDFSLFRDTRLAAFVRRMMDKRDPDRRPTMTEVARYYWGRGPLRERHPDFLAYRELAPAKRPLSFGGPPVPALVSPPIPSRFPDPEAMYRSLAGQYAGTEAPGGRTHRTGGRVAALVLLGGAVIGAGGYLRRAGDEAVGPRAGVAPAAATGPARRAAPGLSLEADGTFRSLDLEGAGGPVVVSRDEGVHGALGGQWRVSFFRLDAGRVAAFLGKPPAALGPPWDEGTLAYVAADAPGPGASYTVFLGNLGFVFVGPEGRRRFFSHDPCVRDALSGVYPDEGSLDDFFADPGVQHFLERLPSQAPMVVERGSRCAGALPGPFARRTDEEWDDALVGQVRVWQHRALRGKGAPGR